MRCAPIVLCVIGLVGCGSEASSPTDAVTAPTLAPATDPPVTAVATLAPTTTLPVVDTAAPEVVEPVSFTSPSGNILCNAAATFVSCYILEKSWDIPAPDGCEFDWGNEASLTSAGEVAFGCYSDFGWDPDAPPLAYGESLTLGTLSCLSEETGMTCTESNSGAEFVLSRAAGTISG